MTQKILAHLKSHSVAWVALFFALGGGSGYAIAATTAASPTVRLCVSKKTAVVSEHLTGICDAKTSRTVLVNQRGVRGLRGAAGPAGSPPIAGDVGDNGAIGGQQGLTITASSTGVYDVTVTACTGHEVPTLVASPSGTPAQLSGIAQDPPVVDVTFEQGSTFEVQAGNLENGGFVATTQGFTLLGTCYQ